MIVQVNILEVAGESGVQFENAFREAVCHLKQANGYVGHSLSRCVESENKYLLLIQWKSVEDHTEGFRNAEAHIQWKRLLDPFYTVRPSSQHFHLALDGDLSVGARP
jgi:heme-degrading monooxygenase HmoA